MTAATGQLDDVQRLVLRDVHESLMHHLGVAALQGWTAEGVTDRAELARVGYRVASALTAAENELRYLDSILAPTPSTPPLRELADATLAALEAHGCTVTLEIGDDASGLPGRTLAHCVAAWRSVALASPPGACSLRASGDGLLLLRISVDEATQLTTASAQLTRLRERLELSGATVDETVDERGWSMRVTLQR